MGVFVLIQVCNVAPNHKNSQIKVRYAVKDDGNQRNHPFGDRGKEKLLLYVEQSAQTDAADQGE